MINVDLISAKIVKQRIHIDDKTSWDSGFAVITLTLCPVSTKSLFNVIRDLHVSVETSIKFRELIVLQNSLFALLDRLFSIGVN